MSAADSSRGCLMKRNDTEDDPGETTVLMTDSIISSMRQVTFLEVTL